MITELIKICAVAAKDLRIPYQLQDAPLLVYALDGSTLPPICHSKNIRQPCQNNLYFCHGGPSCPYHAVISLTNQT